jgi:hypothetical protein
MQATHAVRVAVRVFVDPRTARNLATGPMPAQVIEVLQLAAGAPEKLAEWSQALNLPPAQLVDIAVYFIEHIMMPPAASHYRVLGVEPDASAPRIQAHYRWLLRALHADRPTAGWHLVMAERVNEAYAALSDPTRRAAYDSSLGLAGHRRRGPPVDSAGEPGATRPSPRVRRGGSNPP